VLLGGAANAVSAARSAGRLGLPVTVLADAPGRPPAASSRWTTAWQAPAPGAEVQSSWSAMLEQHPPAVLVPCSDNGVELLARRRADLVALGHAPAEGDDRFLLAMLDKQQTYDLADAAGIARPATQVVTDLASAADVADDLGYPCGAKPRVAHAFARLGTGSKGQVLHDRRELAAYLGPLLDAGAQMLLTEVVAGPDDAYCSYYGYRDGEGRELLQYTKRKLRQYPVRFGTGTYHLSDDVPEAAELGRRFFALSGLRGIGNVEFKRDSRDGQLKLIECNARLTAATELVRRSGIDLLELVYSGATGKAATAPTARYGLHQWVPLNDLRAARAYRRTGELSWPSWLRSLAGRQSFPLFSCSDPGPFLTAGAATGRRALRRGVRRLVRA
jgi:predicted ATP-grasp superfamily ATP-dependent carboligase